ncbi:MAG TPA: HAMP domain-containing sensor histidine kinase [Streptosporangiaceae bacterium]|nr:HAMP domain-containing sensor histidine kinase [Streptosporangiaceae bacterium]
MKAMRQAAGRVPLRIKLVAALLVLVALALAVISMVSLAVFRSYLQDRADAQLRALSQQVGSSSRIGVLPPSQALSFEGYIIQLRDTQGQQLPCNLCTSSDLTGSGGPYVPTSRSWLAANNNKLVTVPATHGGDNWRVLARPQGYYTNTPLGPGPNQPGTLIVGVDLGRLDQAVGWLAKVDVVVSTIIVVALAIVGVAMVRASLRPLTEIEHTAEAIAAGDLSRRVPYYDPRTEMGRLATSLNVMLAHVESAFQARAQSEAAARHSEERMRRFLADASHELRTPLTAIRGYAEYYRQRGGLKNGSASPAVAGTSPAAAGAGAEAGTEAGTAAAAAASTAHATALAGAVSGSLADPLASDEPLTRQDMDRIMERVEQESSRMGGLVEDMLVLARLDQQRPVERRPVDLLTLTADAVQDARVVAPSRSIDLTVGTGAAFLVLGDEPRLRQVISNLMNNALTHTPAGSPISVRIFTGYQQGKPAVPCAILEVADLGPGLTREQASRVFERFYRADQARGRRTGGSGLGLAIVQALVAAHGGTVSLDTAPGHGATFRITLPLAPEALATEGADD